MELFSSFFSAIKSFIKELVLDGSTELKNIELGDYTVLITSIPDVQADLVMIADKEDRKALNKIIPKILSVLVKHKQLFLEWEGNREQLMVLDQPLTEIILNKKKKLIRGDSLVEKPEELLQSLWDHKGALEEEQKGRLVKERDFLIKRIGKTKNLRRKLEIMMEVVNLSEKLHDEDNFLKYQKQVKQLRDQIKDTKYKLEYYLEKVKKSLSESLNSIGNKPLSEGDYKDAYLSLYSFSTKLRTLIDNKSWEKYRQLSKILINKQQKENKEISEAISAILNMNEDIEDYL
jgi:hypothetical protein